MNEFDDIDRELEAAFAQRPTALSRPSLRDVKRRARRRQRQRSASLVGACAIVGVGGAAVLATRSPANQTALGDGDASASTICFPTATTVGPYDGSNAPATTLGDIDGDGVGDRFYAVQVGDNPTGVAALFGVTLDALNELNVNTPDYETFYVGLVIRIPVSSVGTTTTSPGIAIGGDYTLVEGDFPGKVAEMFHITVAQLEAANVDVNGYGGFIVGTKIHIPEASQFAGTTTTNVTDSSVPPQTTIFPEPTAWTTTTTPTYFANEGVASEYIIGEGDTLQSVANAFRVTVAEMDAVNLNNLGYEGWVAGTVINIPIPSASTTTTSIGGATSDCVPTNDGSTTTTSLVTATTVGLTKVGTAVQVANCSHQEGVARMLSDALAAEGFTTTEPDTCTIDLSVTKIIYNPEDPLNVSVAYTLSAYLANAVFEPSGPVVPTLTTGTWVPGSGVLVLLGDDLAGKTLAQIAAEANPTPTTISYTEETAATSTTCVELPQMTLPAPATSTTMPGSC